MIDQKFNQLWVQLLLKDFSFVKNATNTLKRKMKNKERKKVYSEICKYFVDHTVCGFFYKTILSPFCFSLFRSFKIF